MQLQRTVTAAIFALAVALPAWAQRIEVSPALPSYGQAVTVEVKDTAFPVYLPATRYVRSGSSIVIEYEYLQDGFGPARPDFGGSLMSLGELAAGNYTVEARMYDIERPGSAPIVATGNIAVVPPGEWGIYTVPREPQAYTPSEAMVRSAAYFDPNSMRASVSGNVLRVDFDYRADAPAGGATPPGMTTFAAVQLPPLAPGSYRLEGWGRKTTGGDYERFFERDVRIDSSVPVIEYYASALDHYFISAGTDEIALVDRGGQGDWKRTSQTFRAWARAADAPPGAVGVCRFYARGPNSHFYTGSRQECDELKALEQLQRQQAAAQGEPFLGWAYETIAFWALLPQSGQCPGGTQPVYRAYNNRAAQMDSNHRFTVNPGQRAAMSIGWVDEGAHLCAG